MPALGLELPPTAIGKDYLNNGSILARTPSGTGYQLSLLGLLGLSVARDEGLEINLLGLTFGVDPLDFALKLPGIGRPRPDADRRRTPLLRECQRLARRAGPEHGPGTLAPRSPFSWEMAAAARSHRGDGGAMSRSEEGVRRNASSDPSDRRGARRGVLASTWSASAQPPPEMALTPACHSHADLAAMLNRKYAEAPNAVGVQANGHLVEVFASSDGASWTIVVTRPDGVELHRRGGRGLGDAAQSGHPAARLTASRFPLRSRGEGRIGFGGCIGVSGPFMRFRANRLNEGRRTPRVLFGHSGATGSAVTGTELLSVN